MQAFHDFLDIKISFIIRRNYCNDEGKNPIILRVQYRGERGDIFTGLYVNARYWIKGVARVDTEEPNAYTINGHMDRIRHKAQEHYEEMRFSGIQFTLIDILDKIRGKDSLPQTLMEYVDFQIKDYQNRISIDLAKPTFYKYKRVKKYLEEFLESSRKMKNIPISRVDGQLLNQFFQFLRKEKGNGHNSAVTLMNFLKTVLKKPIRKGQIKDDPFEEIKLRFQPVDRGFLIKDEIEKLRDLTPESEAQSRNRDIFLFACYTGLAYTDIYHLTGQHLIKDPDGSFYINKNRQKTKINSLIPLLPVAYNILMKYTLTDDVRDFRWFIPSNQKLNQGLKLLGQEAGIKKPLHMHLARHTFATTITLANGVPIETVAKMLGHSSLKHTLRYARVVGEKIKMDMEKVKSIFK